MIPRSRTKTEDPGSRAVSEVIGFIIIFGLVVTSISLVMYTGIPALEEAQEREHAQNAERAFSVLQDNINDVALRDAPARGTQIRVAQSELETNSVGGYINITGDPSENETARGGFGSAVYRTGTGDEVVYENGAVFRFDGVDSSGMVFEPNWRIREDEVVIPMIRTVSAGGGSRSVSGDTTMNMRASPGATPDTHFWQDVDLDINITSPRADGWVVYLERFDEVSSDDIERDGDSVEVTVEDVERVIVVEHQIRLEIIT